MNDWYFFVLQAVVGNLCASRNLESISLSRGVVVVTNERDTSWAGGLTNKKYFFACIFRVCCRDKMPVSASIFAQLMSTAV